MAMIKKHSRKELPPVPNNREKRAYGKVSACDSADLFENLSRLSSPVETEVPKSMEDLGFGYGYVLYRTQLNRYY